MTFKQRLTAALEALPEKKLGSGVLHSPYSDCYCALGAMLLHAEIPRTEWWKPAKELLDEAQSDVSKTVDMNDETCSGATPEERYTRMHAWSKA